MISARVRFRSWIHRFPVSSYPYFMMSKNNAASRNQEAIKSLGASSFFQPPTQEPYHNAWRNQVLGTKNGFLANLLCDAKGK